MREAFKLLEIQHLEGYMVDLDGVKYRREGVVLRFLAKKA